MVKEREMVTLEIDPETELAKALAEVDAEFIILVSNGERFKVTRAADDIWNDYDPERVRAAIRAVAGTLTPEEGERLKGLIYRGREEGTRPIDRP